MSAQKVFTVGELAKHCGVTVRTLQFYDRSGLLSPVTRSEGGRRLYGIEDMLRLQQIMFFKSFGFSLDEIRDRLFSIHNVQDFAMILKKQKATIEQQIVFLTQTAAQIDETVRELEQSEEVSIDLVSPMMYLAKHDRFLGFALKQFEWDEIKALMEHSNPITAQEITSTDWVQLLGRLKELHSAGEDPYGEKGQMFAKAWWDMVLRITGGNEDLVSVMVKAGSDMSDWPEDVEDTKKALEDFLSPALGHYMAQSGLTLPQE